MSDVIIIPKALVEGDYAVLDFECPHCKSPFTHNKGDLDIKTCLSCKQLYMCDDIGQIAKIGKLQNFVYNGKDFGIEK